MKKEERAFVIEVIDHLTDSYKLPLQPYNKAYRIWFEKKLYREIILDFLQTYKIPTNISLIKEKTKTSEYPNRNGYIELNTKNPLPFYSDTFKKNRFKIRVDEDAYDQFETFITILIHELSHLLLYSTLNKHRHSEVATDLFVMASGLYTEVSYIALDRKNTPGYITNEQIHFAHKYIIRKRDATNNLWKKIEFWLCKKGFI